MYIFFISSQDELIGWESVRASVNPDKHEYLRSRQAEFNQISFYLQVIRIFITSRTSSKFGQIGLWSKLPLSVWKNPNTLIMGKMLITLLPSFLAEWHSFLQVTRTCMKCVENVSPSHIYHKKTKKLLHSCWKQKKQQKICTTRK